MTETNERRVLPKTLPVLGASGLVAGPLCADHQGQSAANATTPATPANAILGPRGASSSCPRPFGVATTTRRFERLGDGCNADDLMQVFSQVARPEKKPAPICDSLSSVFGERSVKVLVAGATGGCGRLVVRRLADLRIAVRVLTRDARRAASLGPVEVVEGNAFSPEDCRRALAGCQAIICTLGDRWVPPDGRIVDGDGVINLAKAAELAGARRFVLVSSGGAGDSWAPFFVRGLFRLIRVMPIIQEKGQSEAYVRSSGLRWTILRPGFLTNFRMRGEPVLLPVTGRAPGLTTRQAVADVAVRCLHSETAIDQAFTIVDHLMRWAIWRGKSVHLDVPWAAWPRQVPTEF